MIAVLLLALGLGIAPIIFGIWILLELRRVKKLLNDIHSIVAKGLCA